ncbi:MAG: hypothetical protein J5896_06090 [Alphaproteobacteria bacterium]|nr:hypothetical protein [Alphaproteobacteria bacterium]
MNIKKYFGTYKKSNVAYVKKLMNIFEKALQPYSNYNGCFFKGSTQFRYLDYLEKCRLNEEAMEPEDVFDYVAPFFQNIPNWNNPGTMINVIPPVNLLSLTGSIYTNMFNPNFAEDHYCGRLLAAELEVGKYLSDLIGWNWKESYGLFTFGGKGTNLYATKIALNEALPANMKEGLYKQQCFMITSATAHPCHYEVCQWLGIGSENCIEAPCDEKGVIDVEVVEKIVCKNIEQGKIFLGFNINGCNTVEFAVDPIKQIYQLNQKIINKYNLKYQPHIHVDAVLGWVWLFFKDYDFKNNPLKFSKESIRKIHSLCQKISEIKYADSIGIDFHKTGFCPYTSSIFMIKNKNRYFSLNPCKNVPLEELVWGNFAPFQTSLELTRSASGAVSALICLKSLGKKGFQNIIGNLFSSTEIFRKRITKDKRIELINAETEGLATLFIIKPKAYENMNLQEILLLPSQEIEKIRQFNVGYGKFIQKLSHEGKINFTYTSSRSYTIGNTGIKIGAIKAYPLSVFLNIATTKEIVKEISKTIDLFVLSGEEKNLNQEKHVVDDMVYKTR